MLTHISSFDSSATASITTSYVKWTLTHPFADYKGLFLGTLYVYYTTAANSPTGFTWKITRDSAGNEPITPETTTTLVTGEGTATSGGFTVALNQLLPMMSPLAQTTYGITANQSLFLWIKTTVATSTATGTEARITFEADTR